MPSGTSSGVLQLAMPSHAHFSSDPGKLQSYTLRTTRRPSAASSVAPP